MKKIKSFKYNVITVIIVFLAIIVGLTQYITAEKIVHKISEDAREKVLRESVIKSDIVYDDFKVIEENTYLISEFIKTLTPVNTEKNKDILKNFSYLKSLYDKQGIVIKTLGQNTPLCDSIYFYYDNNYANNYDGAWFIRNKGGAFSRKITNSAIDPNILWYAEPIKAKKGVWSKPYFEPDLKKEVITFSMPVYKNGVFLGVAGIDASIEEIKALVKSMHISKSTKVLLADANYNVIYGSHIKTGVSLNNYKSNIIPAIIKQTKTNDRGYLDHKENNERRTINYVKLPNGFWLFISKPTYEVESEITQIIKSITVIGLIILFLITYLILKINEQNSKKIIKTLTENKNREQVILDNIPCWAWMKDIDSRCIAINKKLVEDLNIQEDYLLGKKETDVFPKDIAESFLKKEKEVITSKTSKLTYEQLNINGEEIWLEIVRAPFLNNEGQIAGTVGIAREITQQHKIELELMKAKEQAELDSKTKSIFLANMSHEIRTPMNSVLGYIQLLSNTKLSREQIEFINEAKKSSDILMDLINNILDFSKIEAKKMIMENISFDLRSTIEDTVTIALSSVYNKGLNINCLIESKVPQKVIGDPFRLKQVLNNLINNAVKFTHEGEIIIKVQYLTEENNKVRLLFEVQDTGIGISEIHQNKIFEQFTQADQSTTRKFGGTGLGLAISKRIIEMMNGTMCIDSILGEGSTFSFTGEFQKDKEYNAVKPDYLKEIKNTKVLIITKSKTNLKVMKYYLEEGGCKVTDAENKKEALSILDKEKNVSVIILDYNCFGNTGYKFANIIKTNPSTQNIVLILHSAYTERENSEKTKEAGFVGYLPKPTKRHEIIKCIELAQRIRNGEKIEINDHLNSRHKIKEYAFDKAKILVVEDNDINCKLMVKILNNALLTCDIAKNGKEAIKAYMSNKYDLILMDCQMPEMDGYETTKEIRKIEGDTKHTPIIAMTANTMNSDKEKCFKAGMDDYISKPIDINHLLSTMHNYITVTNEIIKQNAESSQEDDLEENTSIEQITDEIIKKLEFSKEDAEHILVEYLEYLPSAIEELEIHLNNKDFDMLKKLAHTLKGNSSNLRIKRLKNLSLGLENASTEENELLCRQIINEIEEYYKILDRQQV